MNNIINRKKIADGVYFSYFNDNRFKTNRIDVAFIDTLDKGTASLNALIPAVLSRTNNNYRTMFDLNRKLMGNYSSFISDYARKIGDNEYFGLYAVSLDDSFAIDGENILLETAEILKDCFFNPYLENGLFPEKIIEIQKKNLMDANDNEINNKSLYTLRKGLKIAFDGEPSAVSVYGENEDIALITPEAAYKRYLEILETKNVEIMCVGPADFTVVEKIMKNAFSSIKRTPENFRRSLPSKLKQEPKEETEVMDVSQSKLLLVFKTESEKRISLSMMSDLFGGDVFSKLFMIVREKMSLCYYCHSRFVTSKRILTVECGVEKNNIEKAKAAILEQLDEIKKGNFTEEDMKKAKLSARNSFNALSDHANSISNWYTTNVLLGLDNTPEQEADEYSAVTKEEIIEAARSLKLDTVFVLTSDKEAE